MTCIFFDQQPLEQTASEGMNTLLNSSSYSDSTSSQQLKSVQSNSKSDDIDSDILRIMNNEHFKYTSNALLLQRGSPAESTATKLEHLMKTNAALSLMSKLNLALSLKGKRHSLKLPDDVSITDILARNTLDDVRSKSYLGTRETERAEPAAQVSRDQSNIFIKRSFAAPSTTFSSLLKSGSFKKAPLELLH
jgi:hypothetical protein